MAVQIHTMFDLCNISVLVRTRCEFASTDHVLGPSKNGNRPVTILKVFGLLCYRQRRPRLEDSLQNFLNFDI